MPDLKDNPVEQRLAKLLEAAYLSQQPGGELKNPSAQQIPANGAAASADGFPDPAAKAEPATAAGTSAVLPEIIETQRSIQVQNLELDPALNLIAQRIVEITKASGVSIGMVESNLVRYRASAGKSALRAGTAVPITKAICFDCVRTSQPFRCPDVRSEILLDAKECEGRGIHSLIAVPIFHDNGVAGSLEIYFSERNAFTDQDVHAAQLMAGLVGEALTREAEQNWKKSIETQRASVLEALERLKPNLAALAGVALSQPQKPEPSASKKSDAASSADATRAQTCRKCGHEFAAVENFCGQCGTPRSSDYGPRDLQSKVAAAWQKQQAGRGESPTFAKAELPVEIQQQIARLSQAPISDDRVDQFMPASESDTGPATLAKQAQEESPDDLAEVTKEVTDFVQQLEQGNSQQATVPPDNHAVAIQAESKENIEAEPAPKSIQIEDDGDKTLAQSAVTDESAQEEEIPGLRIQEIQDQASTAVPQSSAHEAPADEAQSIAPTAARPEGETEKSESIVLTRTAENDIIWSSAATARTYFEQLAGSRQAFRSFWNLRRGDIYLAVAVVVLGAVIRWGVTSHPYPGRAIRHASAASQRKPPDPTADLSIFDRMLISLGLADAPDAPEDKGNPDARVWVDQHSALYYCPGSDLYGKTPGGKFTTQRDAQLDQFEPAYRKACD